MKIKRDFYLNEDVVFLAKALLGKELVTSFDGTRTSGIISETEAYAGTTDRASHAWGGKRTSRTETMYARGGVAYVYLCYGVHSLFNVVTNKKDVPHAVLVRSMIPKDGKECMMKRTGKGVLNYNTCNGPGKVAKALGIHYTHSGADLLGHKIWLEDHHLPISNKEIIEGPRVGVDYAGADALLNYRFFFSDKLNADIQLFT